MINHKTFCSKNSLWTLHWPWPSILQTVGASIDAAYFNVDSPQLMHICSATMGLISALKYKYTDDCWEICFIWKMIFFQITRLFCTKILVKVDKFNT